MITYKDLNPNDVVFTPDHMAKKIVSLYKLSGKILEPCSGEGVFLKYLPKDTEWCEITKGRDFFEFKDKVDWIVTNPPYSNFDRFLDHAFELSNNVVFLVPVAKILKSWGTIIKIKKYGGIVSIWLVPASKCGFPFGFPAGSFHFKKGYKGLTKFDYYDDKENQEILL